MKLLQKIFVFALVLINSGCLDFEELRENPNDPLTVPPSLLFTSLTPEPQSSFSGDAYSFAQYHMWIATDNATAPSYQFGRASFTYETIRNIDKMEEEAQRANAPVYGILGKFFRAYYYVEMTRRMGDIPLSESMMGAENPTPAYDSQKQVYIQALEWLDEANLELGAFIQANPGLSIDGDIYFKGNLKSWQKIINAYTVRILMTLSKKSDDPELDVPGRMNRLYSQPDKYPLLTGINDNAQLEYRNEDGFRQSYNPDQAVYRAAIVYVDTYIEMLKSYEDPRLMVVADPTQDALDANQGNELAVRADFNSYAGADFSANGTVNSSKKLDGDFSFPNEAKYWNYTGQAAIWIGYSEQELNLAEAVHRGWISGSVADHYQEGVVASMQFYGIEETAASSYVAEKAPYIGGEEGLERIHEQMYIAYAENSGWESFFMTRRTGVPTYKFSSENNVEQIPVRWIYPSSENDRNQENYRNALKNQFGSENDSRDEVMWLIK
ncbi:SusD/RagB family nutrient-binding outer membrane lipoprotein [Echinicola shivajiensis]|uniref:SusD/RagB family nutrient-binding outer membrane lipoprotein n=1 Tax=Echinicola shivajiensis TaxID=1035916 RepID=UPI001BFC1823|nr:SusD/RagB family nutrient-binding outer membrane lipoprotein [Echinicola shivajiensis]